MPRHDSQQAIAVKILQKAPLGAFFIAEILTRLTAQTLFRNV